jgi:hypothetical protein
MKNEICIAKFENKEDFYPFLVMFDNFHNVINSLITNIVKSHKLADNIKAHVKSHRDVESQNFRSYSGRYMSRVNDEMKAGVRCFIKKNEKEIDNCESNFVKFDCNKMPRMQMLLDNCTLQNNFLFFDLNKKIGVDAKLLFDLDILEYGKNYIINDLHIYVISKRKNQLSMYIVFDDENITILENSNK